MSIAKFTHVSETQYAEAMTGRENPLALNEIPLPRRATAGSAGYDFVSPLEVTIPAGGTVLIPTGIRAEMDPGWVLMLFPRSSLGFKFALRLSNTVGIIDSRYIPDDRPNCLTAVATDELREMIEKLSNGSSKAGLGIHGLDITENISTHNNLPMGIYVTSVEMDSPAMNAGIQAGDIIVSTNGTETLTMHQLASVLNQAEPGDTGNLKIMRQTSGAYEEMAVEITFGS